MVERAYIFVNIYEPKHVDQNIFDIPVRMSNFGKTPAILIQVHATYIWGEHYPSKFPDIEGQFREGVSIVAPGEWNRINVRTGNIPVEVLGKIVRKEIKSFCCGRIEYDDVWKVRHETGFCWEVNPSDGSLAISESPLNYYT